MSGTLEFMSQNFADDYFAITSEKLEHRTHNKHLKANMWQAIIKGVLLLEERKILQNGT